MKKILLPIVLIAVLASSCTEFLDRKPLDSYDDSNFWYNESNVKQHSLYYYTTSATTCYYKYMTGWTYSNTWYADRYANDSHTYSDGQPGTFQSDASTGSGSGSTTGARQAYGDLSWANNYTWIRRANVFIKRLNEVSKDAWGADSEAFKHWMGVARYFRGIRYMDLVWAVGDCPYFGGSTDDFDVLCKPRDNRYDVMDSAIADVKYAVENMREDDGGNTYINKYVVASHGAQYLMRIGLYNHYIIEKYMGGNDAKAKEYLNLAIQWTEMIMNSGKYGITVGVRETHATTGAAESNPDLMLVKVAAVGQATHPGASYQNYNEGQSIGPSGHFIRSVLFWDGKLANETTVIPNAQDPANYGELYTLQDNKLYQTHDPRLEAMMKTSRKMTNGAMSAAYSTKASGSRFYVRKQFPRGAEHYTASQAASETMTKSASNFTTQPIFRYAEVLLNWITCKAELAAWGGGPAITQADIDRSINVIRARPIGNGEKTDGLTIDPQANAPAEIGVVNQLAPMDINDLPNDLARDPDVNPLLWEIRRERMIELALERHRSKDLRAWGKWLEVCQRYDLKPGKYCAEGYGSYDGGDPVNGWGMTTITDGTINPSHEYYKNTQEGNLHQCGAYFDLPALYKADQDALQAVADAEASGASAEEILLLKNQQRETNTALTAMTGQGTGAGLWCVDQNGVQHRWLKTDGYSGPKFEAMKGWYIVGKHSLLTVTRSELARNYLDWIPLDQITFYETRGYTLEQNPEYKAKQ